MLSRPAPSPRTAAGCDATAKTTAAAVTSNANPRIESLVRIMRVILPELVAAPQVA